MKRPAGLLLLAVAGGAILSLPFWLRKPEAVQGPPPPRSDPAPRSPTPPSLPVAPPLIRPREEAGDPLLQRWRSAIRLHAQKDVLELQAEFVSRGAEVKGPLMALATEDPDPRIRAFTVAVLGRLKVPPAEGFFLERAGDAHEYPRTSALQALEALGSQACLATADRLAADDPAEAVRAAAVQAAKAVRARGR